MLFDRVAQGLVAGLASAAATTGALLTFGWRIGDASQAFVAIGTHVIGPGVPDLAAAIGLVGHVAFQLLWGILAGLLAPRSRGMLGVALTAVAVTLAAVLVHTFVALEPLRLGAGLGGPRAPSGPIVALHLVQVAALAVGLVVARRA